MGSNCCKRSDPDSVGGKSMLYIPFFIRSRIIDSMDIAERLKGSPPNTIDIYVVSVIHYRNLTSYGWLSCFLQNLYREDLFYADPEFMYWSTNIFQSGKSDKDQNNDGDMEQIQPGKEKYEKFSDRFRRLFPGYVLDQMMRIRPMENTRLVNLRKHIEMFRSKDEMVWQHSQWIFEGERKYLDSTPYPWNKIALISFPRSGNSFMRKYSDLLTGTETGTDCTMHISVTLQMQGFKGENIVDDSVWVVKSHSPFVMPYCADFKANKIICVARNPVDVIISYLAMLSFANHSQKAEFKFCEEYPEFWDWFVRDTVNYLRDWYKHVLHAARKRSVPIVFVRFEDMISNPEESLRMMMQFMVGGMTDITGTNAEKRVNQVLKMGHAASQSYSLKDTTRKINGSLSQYTDSQIDYIKQELKDMLYFFGYVNQAQPNDHQDSSNPTGFYTYDPETDKEQEKNLFGFKQVNRHVVDWTATMSDDILSEFQYEMADMTKQVELMSYTNVEKTKKAVQDWSERKLYGKSYVNCK